ncbi:CapA family protein [Verrucomicrobium sp. BvORR106]|uniref:CapA family protein n=1 Tax=Verrucomicrobium sp. BvORR106 TaxID=1403819 RepID=UPI00068DB07E|nr:CapA family protein [Verrucomicrobium sp. BvORR106]
MTKIIPSVLRQPCRLFLACAALTCDNLLHAAAPPLPVWIEESHAGSFYFLAQTLPLNEPHTLVLFDAHSDASAIAKSDRIREAIRKVPSVEDRAARLQRWREQGAIQCFNWIEPLMPAPISEVIWVSARRLPTEERARLEQDAREYLDAHEEGLPRDAGPLAPKFRALDFEQWKAASAAWPIERPFVASIDLDYFATLPDDKLAPEVHEVVASVLDKRGLKALCWALSTPWLKSPDQADKLLCAALDESWRISNAEVRWEPFAITGPDRSMMARLRERKGEQIPSFDLSKASLALRTKALQRWRPAHTEYERPRLEGMQSDWRADSFLPDISMHDRPREPDGSYRLEAGQPAVVTMNPAPTGARVRWWALQAEKSVYRVTDVDFGFASRAPRWIQQQPRLIAEGTVLGELDVAALRPFQDPHHYCGTVPIYAEVIRDGESRFSNVLTLRVKAAGSSGLRAAWSEQFALPYIFGSTWIQDGLRSGPETGWGADCANFLIAGFRAQGWRLPWGSPRDLRQFLEPWQGPAESDKGCVIDFGAHAAALWQDLPPLGELNDADLVVHQLEGTAAVLPLGELKQGRPVPKILQLRQSKKTLTTVFGGDVMLGRRVAETLHRGNNPMASLNAALSTADLAVINLECALLPQGASPDAKALLSAPAHAAKLLKELGVDAVTLANNHSMDRGPTGLQTTVSLLDETGLKHCGAGTSSEASLQPLILEAQGRKMALFSVYDDEEATPSRNEGLMIATTASSDALVKAIAATRAKADLIVIMPHWGREHSQTPTVEQRALAATWLNAGAHLVVGTGPHVVQPLEHLWGGSVAWSLGNLVFDGPGPTREWSRGAMLEVTWDAETLRMIRARLRPVQIANDGTAGLVEKR